MSEAREVQNVLTSENSAEFYAKKLDLATEAAPSEAAQEETQAEPVVEPVGESESEAENEPATEERKPNPKLEKRFSELTKQREEARKEAQREREAREALESRLQALEGRQPQQQQAAVDQEPQPSQFSDAFEYAKALAEYSTEKALRDRDQQEANRKVEQESAKRVEAFLERQNAVKAELPDYEDMVASSDVVVSDQIRDAIIESDVGPRILYHLAENPELAEELAAMSTISALRKIGKLEAQFEKSSEPVSKPVAKKSNAPAPIKPLQATSAATDTPIDSNGEFHGSYQQWRESRKAGKIR